MMDKLFAHIDQALAFFLRWGALACLVSLLLFIAANVFVRFFPIFSMGWADEIIELFFAWMVFLCTAALWRNRSHFRVDLLPGLLGNSKRGRTLEIILSLLALLFFLVFTYQGWVVSVKATDRSPILELPRYLWYMVLPLSGGIIIGYIFRDLRRFFRGRS